MCTNKSTATTAELEMDRLWAEVADLRREACGLLEKGVPCNDHRLVELSNLIEACGLRLTHLWKEARLGQKSA